MKRIIVLLLVILIASCTEKNQNSKPLLKDSIVYVHDTVYVDLDDKKVDKPVKPIPAITKFKVTDWVCAWGKWSGVVLDIKWSDKNPNVLIYSVQHYNEEDGTWYDNTYFDTELEAGKCN